MSWIQKLYETYEACAGKEPEGAEPLMPICHTTQQAQIEIVLDQDGKFKRASVLDKSAATTMIPCTESSGGRSGSKPVNHPFADKLQYVAGDFLEFGGEVTSGFAANPSEPHASLLNDLRSWADSEYSHPKLKAVLRYLENGTVVADLVSAEILPIDMDGKLLKSWSGDKNLTPAIFKVIQNTQAPADAFVRWRVEEIGNPISATWEDAGLISAWASYYQSTQSAKGYCMAIGTEMTLAVQHPAKLRYGGDKAKLISSNDTDGYTFRGRFLDSDEAVSVGFEVTQKAHNALRWLIARQGSRNGEQVFVSWATTGQVVPNPFASSLDLFDSESTEGLNDFSRVSDTDQSFALRLKRAIAGYKSKLDPSTDVVIMGIDSATKGQGRMAIIFCRELKGSEFLERIEDWHAKCAWFQNFGPDEKFIGAPSPRDVALAAFGRWDENKRKIIADDKILKSTVERLLPCIVDGQMLPRDVVESVFQRAINRISFKRSASGYEDQWEKTLGIVCALFRGYHNERGYKMELEKERMTRDYLYGRLLAIADSIEGYALRLTEEGKKRDTTAARLMQRFAARPFSTWATIELALTPYMVRLKAGSDKSSGFLAKRKNLLDEVMALLDTIPSRTSDVPLSGEFLLGFHTQRQSFWNKGEVIDSEEQPIEESTVG